MRCSNAQYNGEIILKQKAQLSLGWADRTVYIRRPASDFQSRKKAISQGDYDTLW